MSCTTILVGKAASYNGSTMIARTEDTSFEPKRALIVAPDCQPRHYRTVTSKLELELPDNPMRYSMTPNVLPDKGVWAANGINSANVGMTATETINANPRALAADPLMTYRKEEEGGQQEIPGGLGEEDLVLTVLPYVRTAREGVLRLGSLLEQYGTYEINGIAFSDSKEVWWMETIGGHHWMAKRVPDNAVAIIPNQRGLDSFDFQDAAEEQREHLCSADLEEFMLRNRLNPAWDGSVNPRLIFGENRDLDHYYNTPRAWYMGRYLTPHTFRWDGTEADYRPESENIPWCLVPERRVSEQDILFLLSSHYQGTDYDPYSRNASKAGAFRSIACNRTNVTSICQIRGDRPPELAGVQWIGFGPTVFTAMVPVYTNVSQFPEYLTCTTGTCSTDSFYWASRLLSALADPLYAEVIRNADGYRLQTMAECMSVLREYDERFIREGDAGILSEANEKLCDLMRHRTDELLGSVLLESSKQLRAAYNPSAR